MNKLLPNALVGVFVDCVLVDPKWRFKGYREMPSGE